MIERRVYTRTLEQEAWVNETEGWEVTLQIVDPNDPGRQDESGRPTWRGASIAVLDDEVVLRDNDRLRRLRAAVLDADDEMSGDARQQLESGLHRMWSEQMLATTERILQQLAAAAPTTFGGAPLWLGAHPEVYAMCSICPCTPGVVLSRRFYYKNIQHDIVITDLNREAR